MNLNDFRTRAARVSGMSTSDSSDTALLDAWANEAVVQFLKDTKIFQITASLAVTAGTADYTLDDEILAFSDVWIEPASGQWDTMLQPLDSSELLRLRLLADSTDTTVRHYALQGAHTLMLYPAPQSSSDTLHILYVPRPSSTLSATADSPSTTAYGGIPTEYHPVLEAYVKWKACEAEADRPSDNGLKFQAEYERGIARVKGELNRKAGVLKAPAVWGRRGKRFPVTPGTDIKY